MAMEHSSPSALLHLSHRLFLCTYFDNVYIMINIINRHPCYKQGLFRSSNVFWLQGGFCFQSDNLFSPLNRLSCHHLARELHTQGAKEILIAQSTTQT